MIIGFGVTFLFIFIMFEAFGISELVWPILFPILTTTFVTFFVVFCIIGLASGKAFKVPSDQEMAKLTSYPRYREHDGAITEYPTYDSLSTGAVYVIPLYCPHCMNKLELSKAEWIGPNELTCQNCQSIVQVGVRENF